MKFFGYADDLVEWWFNWQFSLPLQYCVPLSLLEVMAVGFIIMRIRND